MKHDLRFAAGVAAIALAMGAGWSMPAAAGSAGPVLLAQMQEFIQNPTEEELRQLKAREQKIEEQRQKQLEKRRQQQEKAAAPQVARPQREQQPQQVQPVRPEPATPRQAAPAPEKPKQVAPVKPRPVPEAPRQAQPAKPLDVAPGRTPGKPAPEKPKQVAPVKPRPVPEAPRQAQPAKPLDVAPGRTPGKPAPGKSEIPVRAQPQQPAPAQPVEVRPGRTPGKPAPGKPEFPVQAQPQQPAPAQPVEVRPGRTPGKPAPGKPEIPVQAQPQQPAPAQPVEVRPGRTPGRPSPDRPRDNRTTPRPGEFMQGGVRPLPPRNDAAVQPTLQQPVQPVTRERGDKVDRPEFAMPGEGRRIDRDFGNRVIFRLPNGELRIEHKRDRDHRIERHSRDIGYERLSGGRYLETVYRSNGVRIVTMYNRYGDIIRRSRIEPDGYETVLYYVPEDRWDRVDDWQDPGDELPPFVLPVPVDEYIYSGRGASADDYYRYLDQPPVENVERYYSVDEVKRSPRLREKLRRVDLDAINFASGSADIRGDEITQLAALATGIHKVLRDNPAETFLIEGHTDAVGDEASNLALSDRRAEAVAIALTDTYGIPAENLATQGYGESDLKVDTLGPSAENRRVTIRRITPLVAPVAKAQ